VRRKHINTLILPTTGFQLCRRLGSSKFSAKQNYAFCFFFWKKKNILRRNNIGISVAESLTEEKKTKALLSFVEDGSSPVMAKLTSGGVRV
jgi:hypothetical protein